MRPPELPRLSRWDPLWAMLTAALTLSAIETTYAWAERWHHAPSTFLLSAGLTFASALVLGLLAVPLRLPAGVPLALWLGLYFALGWSWPEGCAATFAALVALRTRWASATGASVLGGSAALALACATLKCPAVAEHLNHKDDELIESIAALFLCGGVLVAVPAALRALPVRLPSALQVVLLALLGGVCALRPRLERGDGEQRLPPAGYAKSEPRVPGQAGPDVFVIVLDTVRADHLSLYGYERETTPELSDLVDLRGNAAVYPRAYANGTWTVPSHASLFTGRLPGEHGAHFSLDGKVRVGFGINKRLPTLAEALQHGGYATLAGYANHWLRSVQGLGRWDPLESTCRHASLSIL